MTTSPATDCLPRRRRVQPRTRWIRVPVLRTGQRRWGRGEQPGRCRATQRSGHCFHLTPLVAQQPRPCPGGAGRCSPATSTIGCIRRDRIGSLCPLNSARPMQRSCVTISNDRTMSSGGMAQSRGDQPLPPARPARSPVGIKHDDPGLEPLRRRTSRRAWPRPPRRKAVSASCSRTSCVPAAGRRPIPVPPRSARPMGRGWPRIGRFGWCRTWPTGPRPGVGRGRSACCCQVGCQVR